MTKQTSEEQSQNFTNEELILMSQTILAMQNQLSNAIVLFQTLHKDVSGMIVPEWGKLSALHTKICNYIKDDDK